MRAVCSTHPVLLLSVIESALRKDYTQGRLWLQNFLEIALSLSLISACRPSLTMTNRRPASWYLEQAMQINTTSANRQTDRQTTNVRDLIITYREDLLTYSLTHCRRVFLEKLTGSQPVAKSPHFMKPEILITRLQVPDQSSPYFPSHFLKIRLNIILQFTPDKKKTTHLNSSQNVMCNITRKHLLVIVKYCLLMSARLPDQPSLQWHPWQHRKSSPRIKSWRGKTLNTYENGCRSSLTCQLELQVKFTSATIRHIAWNRTVLTYTYSRGSKCLCQWFTSLLATERKLFWLCFFGKWN